MPNAELVADLPERALSLTWPWTHFMLALPPEHLKRIENRKPGFSHKSFRGECWVHVTPPKSRFQFDDALSFAARHGVPRELMPRYDAFPGRGIVGRWNVVGLLPRPMLCELPDRWRMIDQVGFVVEGATSVPFVPCNGALGFWRVKPETLALLDRAIAAAKETPPVTDSLGNPIQDWSDFACPKKETP